mgnify:CR=1 FL=1
MLGLLAGCGDGSRPSTGDTPSFFLISRDIANTLGKLSYDEEISTARSEGRLDADAEQSALVAEITQRLVSVATRQYPIGHDWDWEIHVISSPDINAYCSPGGKMVVLSGLLEATGMNPDRIATVIGHEIAHALLEHSRSTLSRDWSLQSGMWIVSKSLKMGTARNQSALSGLNTVLLTMDRNHELASDELGLALMAQAGYNPAEGIQFWQTDRPAGRGEGNLEAFISTHPTNEERLERLSQLALQWQAKQPVPQ